MLKWLFGTKEKTVKLTPQEEAAKMTQEEIQETLEMAGKGRHEMGLANPQILLSVNNLHIDTVWIYGERYFSVKDSLIHPALKEEERYELLLIEEELKVVRSSRIQSKIGFHRMNTLFDGELYIYEEGPVPLVAESRKRRGVPARVLAHVQRIGNQMVIAKITVGMDDILDETSQYEFNLLDVQEMESFRLLVRNNPAYQEEIDELQVLIGRLQKHTELIKEDRITRKGSNYIIKPATPEQITNRKGVL